MYRRPKNGLPLYMIQTVVYNLKMDVPWLIDFWEAAASALSTNSVAILSSSSFDLPSPALLELPTAVRPPTWLSPADCWVVCDDVARWRGGFRSLWSSSSESVSISTDRGITPAAGPLLLLDGTISVSGGQSINTDSIQQC